MRGRLLSGKKGQIYPVFLAVFTLVVLGYAYVAISHSKEIYNPDDSKAYIGQKQMQVYYTLMEAEGVKSFVQLSAIIAAQNSYEGMRLSCTYPESASTAKGSEDWACGSYIYPLWSNSGETCAPDCELSLASKFSEELKRELAKHELATGKRITDDYSLRFSSGKEHYNISGVSRSKIVFESNIIEPDLALAQSLRRFLESRYSINPSFTVTVNKQVESPSSIGEWAKETWQACTSDHRSCLDSKMKEYNARNDEPYKIDFAPACEEEPVRSFFSLMEAFEDCFSSKYTGFACRIDASGVAYSKDLALVIKDDAATLYSIEKPLGGETRTRVSGATYKFSYGGLIKDRLDVKEIIFRFKNARLTGFEVVGYSFDEDYNEVDKTQLVDHTEGLKELTLVKLEGSGGVRNRAALVGKYDGLDFAPEKDKFRLCAKVKDAAANPELFDLKFAMQFKADPAKESLACKDLKVESFGQNPGPDELAGRVAGALGFDFSQIFSLVPIPGLNVFGTTIRLADIVSNLPDEQEANVRVLISGGSQEIMGYQVSCSNSMVPVGMDFMQENFPQSLVLVEQKVSELESNIKSSQSLAKAHPYYDALAEGKCRVPLPDSNGVVRSISSRTVQAVDGVVSFDVNKCNNDLIMLDKILKSEVCTTVVPVDASGKAVPACMKTTCTRLNSILEPVLKKLLESQLSKIMLIPLNPSTVPFVRQVTVNDVKDAVSGKRSFDFSDVIDTKGIDSLAAGKLQALLHKEFNVEVVGSSLAGTIDNLPTAGRNAVLSHMSNSISQEDAKIVFDEFMLSGSASYASKNLMISQASKFLTDEKAKGAAQQIILSSDPASAAVNAALEIAQDEFKTYSAEKKRQVLKKASETKGGSFVRDKAALMALSKGCASTYSSDLGKSLACLESAELDEVFFEGKVGGEARKALASSHYLQGESDSARKLISELSNSGSLSEDSRAFLLKELSALSDEIKEGFITQALSSNEGQDRHLQSEVARLLSASGAKFLDELFTNPNVKALIEKDFNEEVERQLKNFAVKECR